MYGDNPVSISSGGDPSSVFRRWRVGVDGRLVKALGGREAVAELLADVVDNEPRVRVDFVPGYDDDRHVWVLALPLDLADRYSKRAGVSMAALLRQTLENAGGLR